jgi:hypothetical protein
MRALAVEASNSVGSGVPDKIVVGSALLTGVSRTGGRWQGPSRGRGVNAAGGIDVGGKKVKVELNCSTTPATRPRPSTWPSA